MTEIYAVELTLTRPCSSEDMDNNFGEILDGTATMQESNAASLN